MANKEQVSILRQGAEAWNNWRAKNREQRIDLVGADLSGTNLAGVKLMGINLRDANLHYADLSRAQLSGAELNEADLSYATLIDANINSAFLFKANLSHANLSLAILSEASLRLADFRFAILNDADLSHADLSHADFSGAKLNNVYLQRANIVGTNFSEANLTGCHIYGISAWDVKLDGAIQANLVITSGDQPTITVDDLEVAQFIYLLLNNRKIRNVIDTITGKAVLIIGRFTEERKVILDAIYTELRQRNYLPILFDFAKPNNRNLTETITTLARLSCFVIADLTSPSSVPHELISFVPDLRSVAVAPLIQKRHRVFSMYRDYEYCDWVLPLHRYENQETLIQELAAKIIEPAESKVKELRRRRRKS